MTTRTVRTAWTWAMALALAAGTPAARAGTALYECAFDRAEDLEGWRRQGAGVEAGIKPGADGVGALEIRLAGRPKERGIFGMVRGLAGETFAGKRLRISAEFRGEGVAPASAEWNGAKFQLHWRDAAGKQHWPQAYLKRGTFGWGRAVIDVELPEGARELRLGLGFEDSFGALWVRRLTISATPAATESETGLARDADGAYVLRAGEVWKPLRRPERSTVSPGTALDRSVFLPPGPAGRKGRVIATPAGHLAFADEPDRPVRFLSSSEAVDSFGGRGNMARAQFHDKDSIAEYARELRRNGYTMARLHYLDSMLMRGAPADDAFNPDMLDRVDFLIHCLKENGIYVNLDAMSSRTGYTRVDPWSDAAKAMRYFKFALHFDADVRANWVQGVERLLTRVNPYTGLRLAEDPVLALVIGYNEQEFAFRSMPDVVGPEAEARWRAYLRGRYPDFAALRAAWGDEAPGADGFDAVPFFARGDGNGKTPRGADVARFIREVERETCAWYRSELRRMGYPGLVSAYNMTKSWHYADVRDGVDVVTMNSYHAHPSDYMRPGSAIGQGSSVAGLGSVLRGGLSGRLAGKPYFVTEYANVFWNRYRYEQAFVNAGYGAFQGFDGLTAFAQSVTVTPVARIHPFTIMHDPVLRAEEFLAFFLFARGDVRPADVSVRIAADADALYADHAGNDGLSGEQSKLCFVAGLAVSVTGPGRRVPPPAAREVMVDRAGGGAAVMNEAGFAVVADGPGGAFDADALVAELKRRGLLPADNRSVPSADVFESSTGELFLDAPRRFLSVKTPRFQGVCAEAGATADLGALRVDGMTVKGNLALVSLDGDKPLAEASRMMLVFATDALNSDMRFDDPEKRVLRDIGKNPTLVETGRFAATVRHPRAAALRLWPLDLSGRRLAPLSPTAARPDAVTFTVDTGALPDGPALFFELATE